MADSKKKSSKSKKNPPQPDTTKTTGVLPQTGTDAEDLFLQKYGLVTQSRGPNNDDTDSTQKNGLVTQSMGHFIDDTVSSQSNWLVTQSKEPTNDDTVSSESNGLVTQSKEPTNDDTVSSESNGLVTQSKEPTNDDTVSSQNNGLVTQCKEPTNDDTVSIYSSSSSTGFSWVEQLSASSDNSAESSPRTHNGLESGGSSSDKIINGSGSVSAEHGQTCGPTTHTDGQNGHSKHSEASGQTKGSLNNHGTRSESGSSSRVAQESTLWNTNGKTNQNSHELNRQNINSASANSGLSLPESIVGDKKQKTIRDKILGVTPSQNGMTFLKPSNFVKMPQRDLQHKHNGTYSVRNGNGEHRSGNPVELPPRQPTTGVVVGTARHRVNKSGNLASSIPEEEITIPNDGNLASFSADAMATFFRYLRVEDRLINHLHRNGLDGKKFGRLKDTDLENLLLKNPVVIYFRDRTAPAVSKKPKQRLPFVL